MPYCPDNYDQYRQYEAEQSRRLKELPVCENCGYEIQTEHYYDIFDRIICPECLDTYFKYRTEDYIC